MDQLPVLLAGYSIFCALAMALTHFRGEAYQGQVTAKIAGLVLLGALLFLQVAHVAWLDADEPWPDSLAYRLSLYAVAPCFHLYSRSLLRTGGATSFDARDLAHLCPILLAPFLSDALARPLAFLIGAGYLLGLGRQLSRLRAERTRFRVERVLLGITFVVALVVALLGLLPGLVPGKLFAALHASAIGLAFLLVQTTLTLRPRLEADVQEVVQVAYAQTTLAKVDCDDALARLEALMTRERLYVDPELSLATLASRMDLTAHQLSELLNTRLGKGFARHIRELRVEAAKAMLLDEPTASVLSVGLSVGFSSTSNFYDAFREIEGTTPGQYRKLRPRPAKAV
ncbi:MAG: hypothetical protein RL375_4852 [Pseudomonadota bacterium]